MARPRKYATVHGDELYGVGWDRSTNRYYRRVGGNRKEYTRDTEEAREWSRLAKGLTPAIVTTPDEPGTRVTKRHMSAGTPARASAEKLSDCLSFWLDEKDAHGRSGGYLGETERNFREFIGVVTDKPVNQLTNDDIRKFERWMLKNKTSNDWWTRRIKSVRAVFRVVDLKTEYPLPAKLITKWLQSFDTKTHVVAEKNREPITAKDFKRLLRTIREQQTTDVGSLPDTTQSDKARRLLAKQAVRQAVQFEAIVYLAANCSLSNQDICDVKWSMLHLGGKSPHLDFPRTKMEWKTGAIPRRIPLHRETVRALRQWQEFEPTQSDYVFRSRTGAPWKYDKLSAAFKKFGTNGWTFKSLRNVAPTIRRDSELPSEMDQYIQGQVQQTVSGKHYTGQAAIRYLTPLVRAIGARYFGKGA